MALSNTNSSRGVGMRAPHVVWRLSAAGDVEGYVHADHAEAVIRDHLLFDAGSSADVVLHVSPLAPDVPAPLLLVAADLADHDGPRELGRARDLIREWAAARWGEGA